MQPMSFEVERREHQYSLIDFLARRMGTSKKKAKELINTRNVFVNRRRVWMARHILKFGDSVELAEAQGTSKSPPHTSVLFEDDDYLVVDKRSGMVSNGPGSVESHLKESLNLPGLEAAHRLDRDTSGCLMFAKNRGALQAIVELFRVHKVKKVYRVIVAGEVEPKEQTITRPVDGETAVTKLRVLDSNRKASHLQVQIDTGRTHQIRRHLDAIGHTVVGDRYYGSSAPVNDDTVKIGRQMLHASTIEFVHPATHQTVRAKASLPRDFRNGLRLFGLT